MDIWFWNGDGQKKKEKQALNWMFWVNYKNNCNCKSNLQNCAYAFNFNLCVCEVYDDLTIAKWESIGNGIVRHLN